ncbi:Alg9-like mannosyltransferase [Novosphingobium nitrogenifigens DSM 19370]|uniref:Alg9-like mannosyltransferase n=1 Tax=Novosphingobium nitrogenifigens DSM 19370 TaxID=983920 RepID=F1Z973_9SPHN|nr:Alg9-like mannosyltransferase [Novosphingobium nitrogenifigens DSM 19370]
MVVPSLTDRLRAWLGHGERAGRPGDATALMAIVGLALVARLVVGALPIVHHEDEVWQYLEPAYGELTGLWIRTWDIRAGIRSWLMPVLLMPPVALGRALAPGSGLHVLLAREMLALASLGVVWAFYRLGLRVGRGHGFVAAFVAATWVEIVYFAPRTSSDGLALTLLLPAFVLVSEPSDLRKRDVLAGFFCGVAVMLRLQLAPAVAFAVLGMVGWQPRRYPALVGGVLTGFALDAAANAVMGEPPFLWIWRNFAVNLVQGKSEMFGVAPPWWYFERLFEGWHVGAVLLVPAIVFGARRYPVLLGAALVEIATMALIPHKEFRFITLGLCLLILLAAIGSVDLLDLAVRRFGSPGRPVVALCTLWLALSVLVGTSPTFLEYWVLGATEAQALRQAGQVPAVCGIGIYRHPDVPLPAYTFIDRPVPVLMIDEWLAVRTDHPPMLKSAYNVAIAPGVVADDLRRGGYRELSCGGSLHPADPRHYCVYVRQGGCARAPAYFDYNAGLARIDR